jgi:hypothetical protein
MCLKTPKQTQFKPNFDPHFWAKNGLACVFSPKTRAKKQANYAKQTQFGTVVQLRSKRVHNKLTDIEVMCLKAPKQTQFTPARHLLNCAVRSAHNKLMDIKLMCLSGTKTNPIYVICSIAQ